MNIAKKRVVEDYIFSRGMLITNVEKYQIETPPVKRAIQGYEARFFAQYRVYVDPKLDYKTRSSPKYAVAIAGLVLNPFDNLTGNQEIVDRLYAKLIEAEHSFFDYVDQLSGSFIVLFRENDKVRLLVDACAARTAYYHFPDDGKSVSVATHLGILARLHQLDRDDQAARIMSHPEYRADSSRYLPGMITSVKHVRPVIANNFLDFEKRELVRFFPREALAARPLSHELIGNLAEVFENQAKLIESKGPIAIAVTGGKDSRLTLAAHKNISDRSFCFTFSNETTGQFRRDVEIARELTAVKGFTHRVFNIDSYRCDKFISVFRERSLQPIWSSAAQLYFENFEEDVIHVRSTVSEVGRCFYNWGRGSREISPERLAATYTHTNFAKDPSLIRTFRDYIEQANFNENAIFNYDPLDIFYWEHRNSKWQNVLCLEAEIAGRVFIPFNNREILKMLLSVPARERQAASLHLGLIAHMSPDFDSIPIDSAS